MVTTALDTRDSRRVTAKCLILDTKSILEVRDHVAQGSENKPLHLLKIYVLFFPDASKIIFIELLV